MKLLLGEALRVRREDGMRVACVDVDVGPVDAEDHEARDVGAQRVEVHLRVRQRQQCAMTQTMDVPPS